MSMDHIRNAKALLELLYNWEWPNEYLKKFNVPWLTDETYYDLIAQLDAQAVVFTNN